MIKDRYQYVRLVRSCNTIAWFLYGREIHRHIGSGGVLSLYDHIWMVD